jgi:hypothetical protein
MINALLNTAMAFLGSIIIEFDNMLHFFLISTRHCHLNGGIAGHLCFGKYLEGNTPGLISAFGRRGWEIHENC